MSGVPNTSFADVASWPREPGSTEETMIKAVGPLERKMVERVRPVYILDQLASNGIHRQLESPEEINPQDGHLDSSLQKSPLEAQARQLQLQLPLPPALDRKASWPYNASTRSRKAGRMRNESDTGIHQETPGNGIKPPRGL
jgi:hypothetical protein